MGRSNVGPAAVVRRSIGWYSLSKFGPALLTLLAVPVWLRMYGPAEYGVYSVTWAAATLATSAATGWLRQSVLRFTGEDERDLAALPWWSWCVPTAASGVVVSGVAAWQASHRPGSSILAYVTVAAAFTIITALYAILTALVQRYGEASRFATAELARIAVALVATLIMSQIWDGAGATQMLLGYLMGSCVALAVTYRRGRFGLSRAGSRTEAARFWEYGWPLGIWIAVSTGLLYVDRVILSAVRSADEVGQYAAVADILIRGMGILTFPVIVTVHPMVMARWNAGYPKEALALARLWTTRVALVVLVAVAVCAWWGPRLLGAVLAIPPPDAFLTALLALAGGAWQLALMVHKPLELQRRTRLMLVLVTGSLSLTLVVQMVTAPSMGAQGVALGLALGAGSYCVAARLVSRGVRGTPPVKVRARESE